MKKYDNVLDKLIDVYCSKDDIRPQFLTPVKYLNTIAFTDCHMLIQIPDSLITVDVKQLFDVSNGYKDAVKLPEPKLFTYEAFKKSLLNIQCQPDYYYTYKDCRNQYGCKICEYQGTHKVKGKKNGLLNYLPDEDGRTQYVKLGNGFFNPNFIYKVIYLIELLGLELSMIQLTHNSQHNASVLLIGEVTVLIMPMMVPYETTSKEATAEIL